MEVLWQDVRYGVRGLLKTPWLTALVLLLMVLGSGLTVVVFTFLNAALLRPLPFADADRLVIVLEANPRRTGGGGLRPANFFDWKSSNTCFEGATAVPRSEQAELSGESGAQLVDVRPTLEDFFQVLSVRPFLGRPFEADDFTLPHEGPAVDWPDMSGRTAILSHAFWRSHFGGDLEALGQTLELDDLSFTVVGVMPAGFSGLGGDPAVWVPFVYSPDERANRATHLFTGLARLTPGVTLEEATAEMRGIYRSLEQQYPAKNKGWTAVLRPFRDDLLGDTKQGLFIVQLGALVVLLIACINIAALLTTRGSEREAETRLRRALGATPGRILRQVLTESVLLSATGGALAIATVAVAMRFVIRFELPTSRPFALAPTLDATVFGVAVGLIVLSGFVFGLHPALRASRLEPRAAIRSAAARARTRSVVIVVQIMLAMMLLCTGGLVLQSLAQLQAVDLGFNPSPMLRMGIHRPRSYDNDGERRSFQDRLLKQVRAVPGVEDAAVCSTPPLSRIRTNLRFDIEGRASESTDRFNASYVSVSQSYFRTLGATLVKGRYFSDKDTYEHGGAMIINETLARQYWAGEEALGQRVFFPYPDLDRGLFTVVGIVRDITHDRLAHESKRRFYIPLEGNPYSPPDLYLVARTSAEPVQVLESVGRRVRATDPDIVVSDATPMLEVDRDALSGPRQGTVLLTVFAALALLMAASGLYGLLAYSVGQRTREIGLRMALGARSKDVLRMVAGRGAVVTLIGAGIGLAASMASMQLVASMLHGVSPADPLTYAVAATVLIGTALLASYLPARRASRIEPSVALRHE